MTELETGRLIAVIAEIYPHYLNGRNIETTVALWHDLFADDSYAEVNAALKAFVATDEKGFAPAPGAIRALLHKLRQPEGETTETEAWALVQKATRNSIYNADKEFAALPEDIQRCVGSPATLREWAVMDSETLNSVVASNFMRGYKVRAVQVREMQKLPPAVREVFGLIGEAFKLPSPDQPKKVEQLPQPEAPVQDEAKYTPLGEGWKLAKARIEKLRAERQQEKRGKDGGLEV